MGNCCYTVSFYFSATEPYMKNWLMLSQKSRLCYITNVWRRSRPTFAIVPTILVSKTGNVNVQLNIMIAGRGMDTNDGLS